MHFAYLALDSAVMRRADPKNVVVTPAAYLLFYRRRSETHLGGPYLKQLFDKAAGADNESQPTSRATSPSGEGKRLGGSSRNGSSSALIAAGAAHRAGDGGLAPQKHYQGASRGDANQQISRGRVSNDDGNEQLPDYSATLPTGHQNITSDPMDVDEGLDDENYHSAYNRQPSWSFDMLGGKPVSQQAVMPSGFRSDPEEDLFADDASTRAEGAGRSSPGMLSDQDDRLAQFDDTESENVPFMAPERRGIRESAPPPSGEDDEDDDLPVIELHPDVE